MGFLCPDLTKAKRLKYKELIRMRDDKNMKLGGDNKEKKRSIRDDEVVLLNKRK